MLHEAEAKAEHEAESNAVVSYRGPNCQPNILSYQRAAPAPGIE